MGFSYNPGNAIIPPGVTADNGLTETAGNIQLGGTLLQTTEILLNSFGLGLIQDGDNFLAYFPAGGLSCKTIAEISLETDDLAGNGGSILATPGDATMQVQLAGGGTMSIEFNNSGMFLSDTQNMAGVGYGPGIIPANGISLYGDSYIPDVGYVKSLLGSTDNGSVINGSTTQTLFTYNQSGPNALFELGGKLDQLSGIGSVVFNCSYTDWTGTAQVISFTSTETIMVQGVSTITVSVVVTGVATYDAAAYIKLLF